MTRCNGVVGLLLDLLAACAYVRRERVVTDQLTDLGVSYALSRQMPYGCSGVGSGRSIGIESSVPFSSLWVVAVRAVVIEPDRDDPRGWARGPTREWSVASAMAGTLDHERRDEQSVAPRDDCVQVGIGAHHTLRTLRIFTP